MYIMKNLKLVASVYREGELDYYHITWKNKKNMLFFQELIKDKNLIMDKWGFDRISELPFLPPNMYVLTSLPLDQYYDVSVLTNAEDMLNNF